ncbi:hypothetical protein NKJ81_12885 [Mesorhizobium sp. M0018]|uniref:hypothetical protein n=1 Tax=unclassified Mesorhizobium TaxID=325217 RepID=UPI003338981F
MIQFLNILGDVMRIATFQWYDEKPHRDWCEERPPTSVAVCRRPTADRYPVRPTRP